MSDIIIVGAARTPIGKFLGKLCSFSAPDLGAFAIREALNRGTVSPEQVNEVIMGNVVSAGVGQAPARQAAIKAGLPHAVAALTINKVCGSGLKAVMLAAQAIKAGDAGVVVAGGMESMSNAPFYLKGAREGFKMGNQTLIDGVITDGLWDSFYQEHMGNFADFTARNSDISREDQDAFSADSHAKAVAAQARLAEEMVPITLQDKKGTIIETLTTDEGPRPDSSIEKLVKLRPAFSKDGTVTAGNAPGLSDGAAAVVVTSSAQAAAKGWKPLAKITAYATSGTDPKHLFYAPGDAVRMVLEKLGTSDPDYFDLYEFNEAFATQALANCRDLGVDMNRVNVNGGAIALGHPIGASGARVLVTLLYELRRRSATRGCAALCLGGGNAVALAIEIV